MATKKDDLLALSKMGDDDIDYSDIAPLTTAQITGLKRYYKPTKEQITLRLDSDVLAWLKKDGAGYQTRINAILRQAMMG